MSPTDKTTDGLPTLEWSLTLDVQIATPQFLGSCIDGERSNYPILGGSFEGPELRGEILAGGADFFVQRPDGIGAMDASYSLRSDRGEVINIRNRGLLIINDKGRLLASHGVWPLPQSHYCCQCTPEFTVASGRLDWLQQSVFIGTVSYPSTDRVLVKCFRIVDANRLA